jgi:hypothetical protein
MPGRREDGSFPYEEDLGEAGRVEQDPDDDTDFDPMSILGDAEEEEPLPDDVSLS